MATQGLEVVILAIILGTLFAIVYSLRVLVLMERRVSRIDMHIESLVTQVLAEEHKIEEEEDKIEEMLKEVRALKAATTPKKTTTKKVVKKVAKKRKK
jgi:hypothetical protein